MKNQLEALLKQEMSRKEFLQYIGGALLVSFGVTSLMKSLLQAKPAQQKSLLDYGSSAYGGAKKNAL